MASFFKITAGTAIVATALYTAAGYLGVPYAVKTVLERQVSQTLNRGVTVGSVTFNPWTWEFELNDLRVEGKNGTDPLALLTKLRVDASAQSLSNFAPVLDELTIDGLKLSADMADEDIRKLIEGSPDESQSAASNEEGTSESGLPAFALYNIAVTNSSLQFIDKARAIDQSITDFNLKLPFVSTLPNAKESLVTPSLSMKLNGTPIAATGSTKPFGSTLEAQLNAKINGLDIVPLTKLVPALNTPALRIGSGALSTDLTVIFRNPTGGNPGKMLLSGTTTLRNLTALQQSGTKTSTLADIKRLSLQLRELDLIEQHAIVQNITIEDPKLRLVNSSSGLNAMRIVPDGGTGTAEKTSQAAAENKSENAWNWSLESLQLRNGTLSWLDTTVSPNPKLSVTSLNAVVSKLASDASAAPANIDFSAKLLGGSLDVKAKAALSPMTLTADVTAQKLNAASLAPYIRKASGLDLAATLGFTVKASVNEKTVTASADASVGGLTVKEGGNTLLSARSASLRMSALDLNARTVTIENASLTAPVVNIEKNAKGINLAQIGQTSAKPAAKTEKTRESAANEQTGSAWQWALGSASIREGTVNFRDRTVNPAVSTALTSLNVTAKRFSSKPGEQGTLDFSAKFANGTLTTKGTMTPAPLAADLTTAVKGVSLKTLSPVMTAYAGLGAKGGLLNAEGKFSAQSDKSGQQTFGWLGNIDLANFDMTNSRGRSLMMWKDAKLVGLDVKTTDPLYLAVARAEIDQPGTKETKAVKQIAGLAGAIALLAGKEKDAANLQKVDKTLGGKIVLENIRYQNGQFSAAGVSANSVAGALLKKLSDAMSAKLGTSKTASTAGTAR